MTLTPWPEAYSGRLHLDDAEPSAHDRFVNGGRRAGDAVGDVVGKVVGRIPGIGAVAAPFARDLGVHMGAEIAEDLWTPRIAAAARRMAATRRWIEARNAQLSQGQTPGGMQLATAGGLTKMS